jgi:hypothetical protein
MKQPHPKVAAEDVERVARREFPTCDVVEVLGLVELYDDREPFRVRLAILKLAAGNIEQLMHWIDAALLDYRDVLAPAEYPGYLRRVPISGALPPEEEQGIIDNDWKQYQDWFYR